jgi:toxin ParE1/3/4
VKPSEHSIRLLRLAEDDLTEIVMFIAAERPAAAEKVASKIEKQILLLANNPFLGRIPDEEELARHGYRYLVIENYLVFYTVEEKAIIIHRILHGARSYQGLL